MDYIHLLNDSPIVYDRQTDTYELYSPYGEILAYRTRREADNARREILADLV